MKQAILITAYKNYDHLKKIISFFDDSFELYIHLDRKSSISPSDLEKITSSNIVKLITQKFPVNWGSFNHLRSILFLSEQALKNPELYYFHLISGQDFPIKKKADFRSFFYENRERDFIEFFKVPKADWANEQGLDRVQYYNFTDFLNYKIPVQKGYSRKLIKLQKKIGVKRTIPPGMPQLFGGSTWWSLSRKSLNYIVQKSNEEKRVLKRFKYTLCSEEFYFQTVIMNSEYRSRIVNNNLRHIDWVSRNGNNPAILDETDLETIKNSDAFFARKFEYPISEGLYSRLEKEINKEP